MPPPMALWPTGTAFSTHRGCSSEVPREPTKDYCKDTSRKFVHIQEPTDTAVPPPMIFNDGENIDSILLSLNRRSPQGAGMLFPNFMSSTPQVKPQRPVRSSWLTKGRCFQIVMRSSGWYVLGSQGDSDSESVVAMGINFARSWAR